jgi:hypothetical protein
MVLNVNASMEWKAEWAWVGGYSAIAVVIVIFNLLLFFSVAKNSFLHYSTHYVFLALAIRNILRVALTLCIVYLTKLAQNSWIAGLPRSSDDFSSREGMPVGAPYMCDVLSSIDTWLVTLHLYYLSALAIHMFTRYPNPQLASTSDTALKVYGQMASLNKGVLPVKERLWQAPLLILIPPLLALILALPAPLFKISHHLTAVPGGSICQPKDDNLVYQTCSLILGFLLPAILLLFLVLGLSVRRCISCSGGTCVSSWCKEEALLALLLIPSLPLHLGLNVPIIDQYLVKLGWSSLGLTPYIPAALARAAELGLGLLLPALCYALLPAYRKFESEPDASDAFKRVEPEPDFYRHSSSGATAPRAESELPSDDEL